MGTIAAGHSPKVAGDSAFMKVIGVPWIQTQLYMCYEFHDKKQRS
jgi:hypothetical protein